MPGSASGSDGELSPRLEKGKKERKEAEYKHELDGLIIVIKQRAYNSNMI